MPEKENSNRYGWVVVAAGFVSLTITAAVGMFAFPPLQESILDEFDWSMSQASRAMLVWGVVGAIASPVFGRWMDTIGVRPIMLFGIVIQIIATFLISRVQELWQLYLLFGVSSVGTLCTTYIPVATIIAHWFERNRGAATGIALLGLGAGGVGATVVSGVLLESMTWREIYALYAGALVVTIPLIAMLRLPREHEGEFVQDHEAPEEIEAALDGLTLGESVKTRSFWGIGVGDAVTGMVVAMFNVQLLLLFSIQGFAKDTAESVFIVFQLCMSFFTIAFGIGADYIRLKPLVIVCYGVPAVAVLLLATSNIPLAFVFAIVCGACFGGRTAIFPLMLIHSFGPAHVGAIYGLSNSIFLLATGIGPVIGAEVYDRTGSTAAVYGTAAFIIVVSTVLVALMRDERARHSTAD